MAVVMDAEATETVVGTSRGSSGDDWFVALYHAHVTAVLGYALRRVDVAEDAADVVAETFLVAWRRPTAVPGGDGARPWLYAVARRVLANHRRGADRRDRLGGRLRAELAATVPDPADAVAVDVDTERLLASLPTRDREVLELAVWEQLTPREIAVVVGSTALAVRTRLSRVRARLRHELAGNDPAPAGHLHRVQSRRSAEEAR